MLHSHGCTAFSLHFFLKLAEKAGGSRGALAPHQQGPQLESGLFSSIFVFFFHFATFCDISVLRCSRPPSGPFMKLPGRIFVEHGGLCLMWYGMALIAQTGVVCQTYLDANNYQ